MSPTGFYGGTTDLKLLSGQEARPGREQPRGGGSPHRNGGLFDLPRIDQLPLTGQRGKENGASWEEGAYFPPPHPLGSAASPNRDPHYKWLLEKKDQEVQYFCSALASSPTMGA